MCKQPFFEIEILSDIALIISFGYRRFYFKYKGVFFFYSHHSKLSDTLVVFHASVPPELDMPIFRGFDWEIKGKNILSISDPILEKYRGYNESKISFDAVFFLSTKLFPVDSIYVEVIGFFKKINLSELITFGTSAGGLAALRYACHFNSVALVSNAEFYLKKWWNFDNTSRVILSKGDEIEEFDIEEFILRVGPPKKLFLFTNIFDDMTYSDHHVPMIDFFSKYFSGNIEVIKHCEKHSGKYHTTHFPKNTPYKKILNSISCSNRKIYAITEDINWCKDNLILKNQDISYLCYDDLDPLLNIRNEDFNTCPIFIGFFKNVNAAKAACLKMKDFFDWIIYQKDSNSKNYIPSKHGIFSVSIPMNYAIWNSNEFRIL